MTDNWRRILAATFSVLSALSIFFGVLLAILLNWRYEERYLQLDQENNFALQIGSNAFVVRRSFQVLKDTEFYVTRELIKQEGEISTRAELPDVVVFYKAGTYPIDRIHELPPVPDGTYLFHNRWCWRANLLRVQCGDLPLMELKVVGALK